MASAVMSGPATVPSRRRGGSDVGLDVGGGAFDEVPAADVGHQGGVRVRGRDVGEVERVSGAAQAGQGGADQGSGEAFFEVVEEASNGLWEAVTGKPGEGWAENDAAYADRRERAAQSKKDPATQPS
ncbi:hypothetical protein [Streptomyces sp. NPDC056192]|uniref:hypothetical protein n=1 Tax=unclassified Streptomyces TaxID=2593676 RepID=UPI0035DDCE12